MGQILGSERPPTIRVSGQDPPARGADEGPRKTPRQQRSQALVDAIFTATSRVLAAVGVEQSTTTRIAERAGVSIGSLYQYFRDRDELLGAFVERRIEDNLRRLERELSHLDRERPAAMIEALVRAGLATYLDERSLYASLLSHAPLAARRPFVAMMRKRTQNVIASKLREHADLLAPVDADAAAFVIINAFMGVALMAVDSEPGSREALEGELVRMFSRYLLPGT